MSGYGSTILTEKQIEWARSARRLGRAWTEIAAAIGCDVDTVRRVIDPGFAEHRARQIRTARQGRAGPTNINPMCADRIRSAPPDVLAEREARMSAPRSITSFVFGDPSPGYSALDQKNGRNPP